MLTRKAFFQLLDKARQPETLRVGMQLPYLSHVQTCRIYVASQGGFDDGKDEKFHLRARTVANPLRKRAADTCVKFEKWLQQWYDGK